MQSRQPKGIRVMKNKEPIQNKPGYCLLCDHRMKHERLSYEGRTTMKQANVGRLPNDESFLQYFVYCRRTWLHSKL